MFDRGQRNDWFDSPETIAEGVLAGVFFVMFAIHVMTARAPLFDPAAFRDRNFAIGVVIALIMGMLQYVPMVLFPPLLQELQGYPETTIGYLIASRGLGNFASFVIVAQLTRFDARLCLFLGLSIQAFAGWMMGSLDMQITPQSVILSNVLHGFGFGLSYTPMAVLAFSTMPDPVHDAGQRRVRPDPHAGLERVRVDHAGGVRPFDGRGQRQPRELDHLCSPAT